MTSANVEISVIDGASADCLSKLHQQSFSKGDAWNADALSLLFNVDKTRAWKASIADDPAGFVMARQCGDEAEILTLVVVPPMQKQGVGRALLVRCLDELRSCKVRTIYLEVSIHNSAAISLYCALGFSVCGMRKGYYADGTDASVMRLDFEIRTTN